MIVPFSFFFLDLSNQPKENSFWETRMQFRFGPKKAWPKNVVRPQLDKSPKGLFRILGKSLRNHSKNNLWTSRVSFVFRCPTDVLVLPRPGYDMGNASEDLSALGPRLQWLRMPEEWLLLTQGGVVLFLRWGRWGNRWINFPENSTWLAGKLLFLNSELHIFLNVFCSHCHLSFPEVLTAYFENIRTPPKNPKTHMRGSTLRPVRIIWSRICGT